MIKLITGSEHHFNDLCFKIRALASTWLLATIAGCGWVLKYLPDKNTELLFDKVDLLIALSGCGTLGIFVLWILDLRGYQQFFQHLV